MAIQRVGWRAYSPVTTPSVSSSTLLTSLYSVWNGDTTTNELGTSLYGVWSGEYSGTTSLSTSLHGVWNGESTTNTLDTSIYAVYKAEGNANDSIGTNHGTLVNGATFSAGKIGTKSFYFDGVNDYLSLPNNSLNFTGDFSISVWVDVSSISNWSHSFDVINNLSGNYGWRLSNNGNAYYFEIGNGTSITQLYFNSAGDSIQPSAQVSPLVGSAMKNVVITRKAGVGTKMYISGVLKLSNVSIVNPSYLATMSPKFGNGNVSTKLDNICFWNKELSTLEVAQLYNNNIGVDYPFNGNLLASPGDGFGTNHGVVMNGCNFTTGKIGNAFSFDGVNDYAQLPTNSLSFNNDFSVSFWVYFNNGNSRTLNDNGSIISSYNNTDAQEGGWIIRAKSTNSFRFVILPKNNNSAVALDTANNTFIMNSWNHVVVTRKRGTSSKIYVNGSLSASNSSTIDPIYHTTSNCSIGGLIGDTMTAYSNINYVDALSTWAKELSANEVSMLYNGSNGTQYSSGSFGLTQSSLDSVGTNHGNLVNATYGVGKIGNAFQFNGTNAYVSFPQNSFNSVLTGDFTVSLWVYLTSVGGSQTITCNMSSPSANVWNGWELRMVGSSPIFKMWNNTSTSLDLTGSSLSINTWYNIVLTRSYGNRSRIYINSALSNSNTNTSNPSVSGTFYPTIGVLRYQPTLNGLYLTNGSKVDSFNIWKKELTQDEVTQLYNLGTGTQYPFSGQTLPSANNQFAVDNGTLMNGCSLTDGKIGKAFTFDGVNDYVQLPNNSLNLTNNYSINLWLYLSSAPNSTLLSVFGNDGTNKGFYIDLTNLSSYTFRFVGFNNGTNVIALNGSGGIGYLNRWSMATLTVSGTSVKIYLDGSLSALGTMTSPINYIGTTYPTLGAYRSGNGTPSGYLANGTKIDSLSVWQKELTQAEVTELYNSGAGKQLTVATPIVQSGLVLNLDASRLSSYPNTGNTWYDISGNANNGTMTNGPIFGTANGGSINFDGVNDYIDLGTKTTLVPGTTDFTISFWINPNNWGSLSSTSYSPIFVTLVNGGLWIGKNGANFVLRTAYVADDVQYSVLPTVNQWTMVTVNRVGNTAKIYYNGSVVASATVTRNYVSGNSYLGVDIPAGGNYSNVKLSTFSYYNKGLSDSEITQNFNATKSRFGL